MAGVDWTDAIARMRDMNILQGDGSLSLGLLDLASNAGTLYHYPCNDQRRETCPICKEMALLDADISDLAKHVRHTLHLHRRMGKRDHTIPNSNVLQMPPEILGRIFVLYIEDCPSSDITPKNSTTWITRQKLKQETTHTNWNPQRCLILGLVCKLWRNIALSTPYLWTSFQIQFSNSHNEYTSLQVADRWFSRSGSLPLKFNIRPDPGIFLAQPDPLPESVQLLSDIIHSHSNQWDELSMKCHVSMLKSVTDYPYTFPRLRTMQITPLLSELSLRTTIFPNIETLNVNMITSMDLKNSSLQMLTHIELHNSPVQLCVELVKIVPLLRTYKVHIATFSSQNSRMMEFPVEGRHVRTFEINTNSPDSIYLLQNLSFPSLEDLTCIVENNLSIFESDALRIHIRRSGAQLKVFTATDPCPSLENGSAFQYLAEMPSLETLILRGISIGVERCAVSRLFKRLAQSTLIADTTTSTVFLPNLRSLTLCYEIEDWDDTPKLPWNSISQIFGPLAEIGHASRRPLNHLRIILECPYPDTDDWSDQINLHCIGNKALEELMQARKKGVTIEVGYSKYAKDDIALDILELSCRVHNVEYIST